MNIQAKFLEIKDATQNLNKLVEGMAGLSESLVPNDRILQVCEPMLAEVGGLMERTVSQCRQEIGEAVQIVQSAEQRISSRLTELEAEVTDLRDMLEAIYEAASSKKRRGR